MYIEMLRRLKDGLMWYELSEHEQELVRHLDDIGLSTARCDIKDGIWMLTSAGEIELDKLENDAQNRADDEEKRVADEVKRRKERKQDRRDKWLIALVSACFGYVLRFGVEHIEVISAFLRKLLQ